MQILEAVTSVDNILLDSSHHTKAEFNNCRLLQINNQPVLLRCGPIMREQVNRSPRRV